MNNGRKRASCIGGVAERRVIEWWCEHRAPRNQSSAAVAVAAGASAFLDISTTTDATRWMMMLRMVRMSMCSFRPRGIGRQQHLHCERCSNVHLSAISGKSRSSKKASYRQGTQWALLLQATNSVCDTQKTSDTNIQIASETYCGRTANGNDLLSTNWRFWVVVKSSVLIHFRVKWSFNMLLKAILFE